MMSATNSKSARARAEEMTVFANVSFKQIARAVGLPSVRSIYSNSLPERYQARFDEFETLILQLPGDTPEDRLASLLDSSSGASIYRKFCISTPRDQQIHFPIPLDERF